MSAVPLTLYHNNGWAKMLVGAARGKDKADIRQTMPAREAKCDAVEAM